MQQQISKLKAMQHKKGTQTASFTAVVVQQDEELQECSFAIVQNNII